MKQVPHIGSVRRAAKKIEPGKIPAGRLGVYSGRGNLLGHVGKLATAVTASRFGARNAKLKQVNGALAGQGQTLAEASAGFKNTSDTGTNPAIPKPTIGGPNNG